MRVLVVATLLAILLSGGNAFCGSADYVEFQRIIDTKCSRCHTRDRIEQAIRQGENFDEIITKMIRLGANLSASEKQVLGVFWSAPAPEQEPVSVGKTVTKDPLGEYRAILQRRCTGCHSLERVEEAMAGGRPLEDLLEMMRKRGAIVTPAEKSVLDTFWGSPFKQKKPAE